MRLRDILADLFGSDRGPRALLTPDQLPRVRRIYVAERDMDEWVATAILQDSEGQDVRYPAASHAEALSLAHRMASEVAATGRVVEVSPGRGCPAP